MVFKEIGSVQFPVPISNLNFTVASFRLDWETSPPDWIDRVFGHNSVWYKDGDIRPNPLTAEEELSRNVTKQQMFSSGLISDKQNCAFEVLGFAYVGDDQPFTMKRSEVGPTFGDATLSLNHGLAAWPCVYRALNNNWPTRPPVSNPQIWPVLFYCPSLGNDQKCQELDSLQSGKLIRGRATVEAHMKMNLHHVIWEADFVARINIGRKKKHAKRTEAKRVGLKSLSNVAVCGVMSHAAANESTLRANGAMLLEWMHYYTKLGMKVMLYDRDGRHESFLSNATRRALLGMRDPKDGGDGKDSSVLYFPYTVRGMMDPRNVIVSERAFISKSDHDKTATTTLCRFEAKTLFNTDLVLVVDFDEFLYCPTAAASLAAQRQQIMDMLNYIGGPEKEGYIVYSLFGEQRTYKGQVEFLQRVVVNKTSSPARCLEDMVHSGASVFDCFGASQFFLRGHSVKSLHIGHQCPLTDFHQACPALPMLRTRNCLCDITLIREYVCQVVHLSTKQEVYDKVWARGAPVADVSELLRTPSDLFSVAEYKQHKPK